MHWRRKWQPTPVFLPGESQGRGAWWAAVYGVAQSQTRLKRLSSSSTHTPLISNTMETTNEPTKHVEKQRKSISLLMCFSINGLKIFVALCFWLWVEQPTSMYSESICSDSETHHNRVLKCKQQMMRQKGVCTCG